MNRMTIHAEVGKTETNAITYLRHHRIRPRPDTAIEGKDIKVSHDIRVGREGARRDRPFLKEDQKMAIDRFRISLLWMNDEEPLHAHRHLSHLVGVRIVHLRPMLNERKFVSIGLTRRNVLLRDATDAVHSVRQDEAVPVHCSWLRELVRDQDANAIALHGFNRRARCLPVITPAVDHHAGRTPVSPAQRSGGIP